MIRAPAVRIIGHESNFFIAKRRIAVLHYFAFLRPSHIVLF